MSFQRAKEPIDFFEGELLEENQVSKFWTQEVALAEIENILQKLEKVSVPIISEETIVPQGIKYFLQIGNGTNSITFKWRNRIPVGWEPIIDVANILLRMAGEELEL